MKDKDGREVELVVEKKYHGCQHECGSPIMDSDKCHIDACQYVTKYRPLTESEVEEWKVELKGNHVFGDKHEHFMCALERLQEGKYILRYKGQPVSIRAKGGQDG